MWFQSWPVYITLTLKYEIFKIYEIAMPWISLNEEFFITHTCRIFQNNDFIIYYEFKVDGT